MQPSDFDEDSVIDTDPAMRVQAIAAGKARQVAGTYADTNAVILGADTVIVVGDRIIGKPKDAHDARNILQQLSGTVHTVWTGLCFLETKTGTSVTDAVQTRVYFRNLTASEIDAYVATEEPMGKAGAYAIQEVGAILVEKIEGDFWNVVGLPLTTVAHHLKKFGIIVL